MNSIGRQLEMVMRRVSIALMAVISLTWITCAAIAQEHPTKKSKDSEKAAITLCKECGQIKGVLCEKCGLVKGSLGCCKIDKNAKGDIVLCSKCGEIKGTDKCCQADAAKCAKCGLIKGSPGCCKIGNPKE